MITVTLFIVEIMRPIRAQKFRDNEKVPKLRWRHELDEIISMAAGGTHSVLEYRHDLDVQRAHGLPEPVKQARFRKPDGTSGPSAQGMPAIRGEFPEESFQDEGRVGQGGEDRVRACRGEVVGRI